MDRGPIYTDRILTLPDAEHYTVHFYDRLFSVVVTSQESALRRWMTELDVGLPTFSSPQAQNVVATVGLKWPDNAHCQPPLATIQLCVNGQCLVFQIARAGDTFPSLIKEFLEDGRFVFHGWLSDHRSLRQLYGVIMPDQGSRFLPQVNTNRMLMIEQAVLHELGLSVSFPEDVFLSRWDVPELSIEQVQYAALEACLIHQIAIRWL